MANERLQRAHSDLEDELVGSPRNSKIMSSQEDTSPCRESEVENNQTHLSASDKNIGHAIRELRSPTHKEGETQDDYDNRLAASSRLRLE